MFFRPTSLLAFTAIAVLAAPVANAADANAADAKRGEHPLDRAIAMATSTLDSINENIKGYRCTFVKAERIDGKVDEHSFMEMRVRHEPFSVYLKFVKPNAGQQALFIKGKNDDNLLAKPAGLGFGFAPTLQFNPLAPIVMKDQRYPITEAGIKNLTLRLLEVARHDRRHAETEVKYYPNAKVAGRFCNVIEVIHPEPRDTFLFHKAQVFVDRELNIPIRYAAYSWPSKPGEEPPLEEEYTYLDFKIDNGLTDADFEIK